MIFNAKCKRCRWSNLLLTSIGLITWCPRCLAHVQLKLEK